MDDVTRMEGLEDINAGTNARSGPDAAATRREAANQAVAAMSRRVSGGGKSSGMVAGYARPGADQLHRLAAACWVSTGRTKIRQKLDIYIYYRQR